MKRRTFLHTLFLIGLPSAVYPCADPWRSPVSLNELILDSEDLLDTNDFLELRYGKNNWKSDASNLIYFEINERYEGGINYRVGVGSKLQEKEDEYIELDLIIERLLPYTGRKLDKYKKYGEFITNINPNLPQSENDVSARSAMPISSIESELDGKYFAKVPHLVIRENLGSIIFGNGALPYYKVSANEILAKARFVAIFSYKNKQTKMVKSRIVGVSNVVMYVQSHCGGTYLVDK